MKVHCPGCSQEGVGETLGTLAGKALPRENFIAQSRQGLQCPAVQMEGNVCEPVGRLGEREMRI